MFFVFGISSKKKDIDFLQTIVCPSCGVYGRLEVLMRYSYFSLFFIPIIKWNKRYYVRTTCCGSLYTIDNNLGKDIERGQISSIKEEDMHPININYNKERTCYNCNHSLESGYEYCPNCGNKI